MFESPSCSCTYSGFQDTVSDCLLVGLRVDVVYCVHLIWFFSGSTSVRSQVCWLYLWRSDFSSPRYICKTTFFGIEELLSFPEPNVAKTMIRLWKFSTTGIRSRESKSYHWIIRCFCAFRQEKSEDTGVLSRTVLVEEWPFRLAPFIHIHVTRFSTGSARSELRISKLTQTNLVILSLSKE